MKNIRSEEINFGQITNFLSTAKKKIDNAEKILKIDEQFGFQMAYEGMLRASLGFMLSFGKRARSGAGHHKVIIDFVSKELGSEYRSIVKTLDLMRRKRNEAIYEPISSISKKEAQDSVVAGKKYIKIIINKVEEKHPQLNLFKK